MCSYGKGHLRAENNQREGTRFLVSQPSETINKNRPKGGRERFASPENSPAEFGIILLPLSKKNAPRVTGQLSERQFKPAHQTLSPIAGFFHSAISR
jgi:hypothetical protein